MHRSVCSAALACALLLLTATIFANPAYKKLPSFEDLSSRQGSGSVSNVEDPKAVKKESKGDMPKSKSPPEYLGGARVAFAYYKPDFAEVTSGVRGTIEVYRFESGKLPEIITHIGLENNPGSKEPYEAAHWNAFRYDAKGIATDKNVQTDKRVQMKCSGLDCQFYDGVDTISINRPPVEGTKLHQNSLKQQLVCLDDGVWELYERTQESPASIATLLFSPLGSSFEFIKSMITKRMLTKKTGYAYGIHLRVIVFNPQVFEATPALLSDEPLFDKLLLDKFMLLLANDLILFSKGK